MRWNYRIGAVATALSIGSGAMMYAPHVAHAANDMTFDNHLTNEQWLYADGTTSVGGPNRAPTPGTRFVLRFDMSQGGTIVGFSNVECTVTFNGNMLCSATDSITGVGDIVETGLIRNAGQGPPLVFDNVVSGGTFGYRGIRGDAHHHNTGPGTETETLNLA